jgi:hypothetical protein
MEYFTNWRKTKKSKQKVWLKSLYTDKYNAVILRQTEKKVEVKAAAQVH